MVGMPPATGGADWVRTGGTSRENPARFPVAPSRALPVVAVWRLRLECRSYQEQQEQRQSSDLQLARFGKNHATTLKMQRTGA